MIRARLRTSVGLAALFATVACGTEFSPLVPEGAEDEPIEPTRASVRFSSRLVGDSVEVGLRVHLAGWPLADPSDAVHLGPVVVPFIGHESSTSHLFQISTVSPLTQLPDAPFTFTTRAPDGSSDPDLEVEFPAFFREPGTAEICLGDEDVALRFTTIGTIEGAAPAWRLRASSIGAGNSGGNFSLSGLGTLPTPFPLAREVLVALGATSVIELLTTAGDIGTRGGVDAQVTTSLSAQWLVTVSELAAEPCTPVVP